MKRYLYFLLFLFSFASLSAQSSFSGKVSDEKGSPLAGAYVMTSLDSVNVGIIITDTLGFFTIDSCPTNVRVDIRLLGYQNWQKQFYVSELPNRFLEVRLSKSATSLPAVEVKAEIPEVKKVLGGYAMENVYLSPFAKQTDAQTFLNFVPVLNVDMGGSVSILNKKSPANIYIDGRPATIPLSAIPADYIHTIVIIPVLGAEFGSKRSGGIINVILKKKYDKGTRFVLSVRDRQSVLNSQSISGFLSYGGKKINILAAVTAAHNMNYWKNELEYNYFNTGLTSDIFQDSKTRRIPITANFNLEYFPKENHVLGLQLGSGSNLGSGISEGTTQIFPTGYPSQDSVHQSRVETKERFRPTAGAALYHEYSLKDSSDSKLKTDLFFGFYQNGQEQVMLDEIINNPNPYNYYIQETSTKNYYTGLKTVLTKNFDDKNTLKVGGDFFYFNVTDQLFLNQDFYNGLPQSFEGSNRMDYEEITAGIHATYERIWSDQLETSIGLRGEYYKADGIVQLEKDTIARSQPVLLPFFSIYYLPHDDHELSLDVATSTSRPNFSMLNPFRVATSTQYYQKNKPNLTPTLGLELMFNYTLFSDYIIGVDYWYTKNTWSEFTLPDEEGNLVKTTANYGIDSWLSLYALVNKSFFNNRWFLKLMASVDYDYFKGSYDQINIDQADWYWSARIENLAYLDKKRTWLLSHKYGYSSPSGAPGGEVSPAYHWMSLYVKKTFKNSSLTLSGNFPLCHKREFYTDLSDGANYSYITTRYMYPSASVSYTYTFGNKDVRQIRQSYDSNVNRVN